MLCGAAIAASDHHVLFTQSSVEKCEFAELILLELVLLFGAVNSSANNLLDALNGCFQAFRRLRGDECVERHTLIVKRIASIG